ncbi:unnamed protein product [Didymodactylos carnosus]|uniref:Myb/SANT-like DNA-binding domain-containing protein n=1 Tax=Didymodactylos carnosus TaxID=1234261 RepID=A0A814HSY4_9BILA|nr:unnamed protein product [Didymodactylos carnosus]CAF1014168.1 unnamed protein product [Didymodactylos carnosus]CAF3624018.1 unnamed protein product [Didymodactylos carnosus]CAF3785684.1 unnamed protein product [Didymodactylos carnosus]
MIWDLEETRALLDLLKDDRIFKAIESVRTREIYHEISERLKQQGFNRDWNQIRGRVKNLKFSYKKARSLHEEQGQSTLTCRFYDDLHYLFGHKYKKQRISLQHTQRFHHSQSQQHRRIPSTTTQDLDGDQDLLPIVIEDMTTDLSETSSLNKGGIDLLDENKIDIDDNDTDIQDDQDLEQEQDLEQDDEYDETHGTDNNSYSSLNYIQRKDLHHRYPILATTYQNNSTADTHVVDNGDTIPMNGNGITGNDPNELDVYIKQMPSYKHQAYLMDDILNTVMDKFISYQKEFELRFIQFQQDQKKDDQEREERLKKEQREHELHVIQLIIQQTKQEQIEQQTSGRSYLTGEQGYFPLKNVRKTSETDTWTLHKSCPLANINSIDNNNVEFDNTASVNDELNTSVNQTESSLSSTATIASSTNNSNDNNNSSAIVTTQNSNSTNSRRISTKLSSASRLNFRLTNGRINHSDVLPTNPSANPGVIRLFCVRHGERVDFAFGPAWPEQAFDKLGNYQRMNLNMPVTVPKRRNPWRDFLGDSPVTEIGMAQARLTGEALAQNDSLVQYCYTSPALRCIQTAHCILEGMGIEDRVKIRIEPGLFEFLGWYERGLPTFLTSDMLQEHLFNIDKNYRPIISVEKLSRDEKYTDYYNRSFKITQQITDKHKLTGATLLFVGHAATLEVCTRQLCSQTPRSYQDFNGVIRKVSYLGMNLCERNPMDGTWSLKEPTIPPLQHSNNILFDWKTMKST